MSSTVPTRVRPATILCLFLIPIPFFYILATGMDYANNDHKYFTYNYIQNKLTMRTSYYSKKNFHLMRMVVVVVLLLFMHHQSTVLVVTMTVTATIQQQVMVMKTKPFTRANINYTFLNEYYKEHYKHFSSNKPLFPYSETIEDIYNAREGVILFDEEEEEGRNRLVLPPTIEECGICLLNINDDCTSNMEDSWSITNEFAENNNISQEYLQHIRELLNHRSSHIQYYQSNDDDIIDNNDKQYPNSA